MKLIKYLTPIISILMTINLFLLYYIKPYRPLGVFLFFILLITTLTFFRGIFCNKKKVYQNNLNIYLIIYSILVIFVTLIYHRNFSNSLTFHILPGHVITKFLSNDPKVTLFTLIYNYLGNLFLLIPLTILLALKNKKYANLKKMFIILLSTTLVIELIQGFTGLGEFDIDDIIFNVLGGILTLFFILKYKLLPKIRKFFNTNFHLRKETIAVLYIFNIIIIIIYNYLTFTI